MIISEITHFIRCLYMCLLYLVLGESDIIYTNTLLGLERANLYKDKTIMILGGGDGGLLYELLKLSPRLVIMVEVRLSL